MLYFDYLGSEWGEYSEGSVFLFRRPGHKGSRLHVVRGSKIYHSFTDAWEIWMGWGTFTHTYIYTNILISTSVWQIYIQEIDFLFNPIKTSFSYIRLIQGGWTHGSRA